MGLQEYKRKRDFTKTPEPPPARAKGKKGARKTKAPLSYLIQKHDATRLHYDFRLELDGVLLSWAVTRGPSLDPAEKRLAVRTEDHPLSYGSFEGTIPKGEYGGGTVMLWDTGYWEPKGDPRKGIRKGHLSFTLHGERLKGDWALIRMRTEDKRENWLLVKEKDAEASDNGAAFLNDLSFSVKTGRSMDDIAAGKKAHKKKSPRPSDTRKLDALVKKYPEPQLATLVETPPAGDAWLHEVKFDGYRLLGYINDGEVRLLTRNGNDWTVKFPSIAAALEKLDVKSAVLDMEAVVVDESGKSSFSALQAALGDGGNAHAVIAYVFDLLHENGKDISGQPLIKRKAALEKMMGRHKSNALHYSEHIKGNGDEMIRRSCALGLEGILSKDADAPYRAGRQKTWLKSKCTQRQEFIILGYSAARRGERAFGALYLGYYKQGILHYAGKVGTGFSMKLARDMMQKFQPLAVKSPSLPARGGIPAAEWKNVHWLRPVLLCEVSFTEWTKDGHIRHPSFEGMRGDKQAGDVVKEKPVKVKTAMKSEKKDRDLVLHGITITHPVREISETGHITKGALAEYYAAVMPHILPEIVNRPLSLLRCPSGIGDNCFYQRSTGRGLGDDVYPYHFRHKGKNYEYLYIKDERGLMEIIQMGAIEIHPWGATVKDIDHPDHLIFDLDPAPELPFDAVKLAAEDLRARLAALDIECGLKCTGGKGLHIVIPLDRKSTWAAAKDFAAGIAKKMAADTPEAYVATMSKAKRHGKIFIDYFRNDYTATAIAPYAVRAREGAPVAVPLHWAELKPLSAANAFTINDMLKRLKGRKKLPALPEPQSLRGK